MLKKGGKKTTNTNQECEVSTIGDAKIIVGSAFGVFACFLFAMIFIYIGMSVSQRYIKQTPKTEEETIIGILPLQYETKTVYYNPKITNIDDAVTYRQLLKKVGGEEDYYVIRSNTEYNDVLTQLELMGATGDVEPFELSDDFFSSGSIILTTKESSYLTDYKITSLTRDENYHISINTYSDKRSNNYDVSGIAVMAKIDNVQPKFVNVENVYESELDEDNS